MPIQLIFGFASRSSLAHAHPTRSLPWWTDVGNCGNKAYEYYVRTNVPTDLDIFLPFRDIFRLDSAAMEWFRWTEGTPSISGAKKMDGPAPCTADCAAATDKLRSEVERLRAEVARLRAAAATPATLHVLGGAAAAPEVIPADREDTGPSKVECLSVGLNYGRSILPCLLHQTVTDLKGESVRMTMRDGKTFCGVIHALNLDDSALPEKQRNKIVLSLPQSQHKLFISTEKISSVDAGSDSTHIANMSRSAWKKVGAVGKGHADKDKDKDEDGHKSSSSSIENNATDGRSDSSIGSGSDSRKKNSDLGGSGPSPVPVSPSSSSSSANSSSSSASSSGMKRVRGGSKAALLVEVKKEGKVARTASNSFDLSDSDNDLVVRATSSAVDLCDTSDGEEEEEEDGPMVLL